MDLSVQNVYGLILRSKLLPVDEAKQMYDRWQREARGAAHLVPQFLKWLVTNRYVTEYQAKLLERGHAEGFFLSQYKILDRLGRGRMAGVYHAIHELGQQVAIKVLPPSKAKDPLLLARFQREARLAVRLKHANVVRAFQVGEDQRLHYIVMEYLEGETLDDVLRRLGKLTPGEAVRLVHQALLGLQHIHEQGLVHRDLKPANLMLTPAPTHGVPCATFGCTVKILDIGLARQLFDENVQDAGDDANLTSEGIVLGTPDYMAPEQARDSRTADIRADIYSLGCVLYHLLAGHPPFPDTNVISQMVRHATEPPRPIREINPAVPDGLQQILNWMLAKDPNQRYPTPERAAQGLQVFLAAGGETPTTPEVRPEMQPYLKWLDQESGQLEQPPAAAALASPAPPPMAAPVAVAAVAPPAAKPAVAAKPAAVAQAKPVHPVAGPSPRSEKERRRKRRREVSQAPSPAPPLAPLAEPAPAYDVELVPASQQANQRVAAGFLFSRRDFVMFGLGALSVLAAIFMGWVLANLLGGKDRAPPATERSTSGE